jgi:hypothetical protein
MLHTHAVHRLKKISVISNLNMDVPQTLILNSCNLQLGKTIGQGTCMCLPTYVGQSQVILYLVHVPHAPSGEFGIVYKGLLKKSFNEQFTETVAVKTLKGQYNKFQVIIISCINLSIRFL